MSAEGSRPRTNPETGSPTISNLLHPTSFDAIEGWAKDDHTAALSCFRVTARRMLEQPYKTKSLESAWLIPSPSTSIEPCPPSAARSITTAPPAFEIAGATMLA